MSPDNPESDKKGWVVIAKLTLDKSGYQELIFPPSSFVRLCQKLSNSAKVGRTGMAFSLATTLLLQSR
jgi:hypothetical protein